MIALATVATGLALFSFQIAAEWLANHRRSARAAYAENFQRTDMIYPRFVI